MQIRRDTFGACAARTQIIYIGKQHYFHNNSMAAMLKCNALWGVEGKAGKPMSLCMGFIEFLGENSQKL